MKIDLLLRKRRGRRDAPRLSLFPFLAVLICTMGALAVLFLAVTRQARMQARREAASRIAARQTTLKADQELVQWRIEQLKKSRAETETQLADARLQLGHVEEHAQRLAQRLDELRGEAKKLEEHGMTIVRRRGATQEELTRMEGQLREAQAHLERVRQQVSKRPRSYAIIPYEGPNETHRRPIYVECRADAIYIQPEGVRFGVEDFEGPPGAGNPLAAALRATREYLLSQGGFDIQRDGEPYPLLLVRPNGIVAYYAARAAMQSWASEYGYELIGDDWQLQYPQPDARLAQAANRAADMARARQREIIAAAPRSYGTRSKPVYRAGASGGLVRDDGNDDDHGGGYRSRRPAGRYGRDEGFGDGSEREGFGSGGSGGTGGTGTASGTRGGNGYANGSGRGTGTGSPGGSPGDGNEHPVLPYGNINVGGTPGGTGSGGGGVLGGTGSASGGLAGGMPAGASGAMVNSTGIASGTQNGTGTWGGTGSPSGSVTGGAMPGGSGVAGGMPVSSGGTTANGTGIASGTPNGTGTWGGSGFASGSGVGGGMPSGSGVAGGLPGSSGGTMPGSAAMTGGMPGGTSNNSGIASGTQNNTGMIGGTPGGAGSASGNQGGAGSANGSQGGAGSASGTVTNGQVATAGQSSGAADARPVSMEGYVAGRPTEAQTVTRRPAPTESSFANSMPATPPRPGEYHPSEEFAPPPKRDEEPFDKKKRKDVASVAEKRGIDWGIRNAARGSVAVTRQIRVECYADRLVLPGGKVIPVDGGSDRAIDKFMSAVWEHMDSWGLAGQRMYWRPILDFYVAPGGEPRFDEMKTLLTGSGLTVERKQ